MNEYQRLQSLLEDDPDEAVRQATALLDKNCEDAAALFMIATVYTRAERFGLGYNMFRRICDMLPDKPEPWNNLGMCLSGMGEHLKARKAYTKAWERKKQALYAANIGITHMEMRDHQKALEWCERSLNLEPDCKTALVTRGLSRLATGDWVGGWKDGRNSMGGKFRKILQFNEEPIWDGTYGQSIVVYGEQGLGDEIMYASCLPDINANIVVECDPRLEGLFRRSFPTLPVYGTRREKEVEWPTQHKIEASIPIGQLPEFCRPTPDSCPGTPYLVADPERRIQWRALFDSWGRKPKIGIAWSGGSKHNNPKAREAGLEAFRPLIEAVEADWISLQYKDPSEEIKASGLPVRHYKRACEGSDYDDTAALVAELDLVIGVPTTVIHLAGALGIEAVALVHPEADWNWQIGLPWYETVTLFKKEEGETWSSCVERYSRLHRVRAEAASGVQRAPAFDSASRLAAGEHHTADPQPVAHQAARAY